MGLDMYLTGKRSIYGDHGRKEKIGNKTYEVDSIIVDLAYWRKHSDLHGYIVQTFAEGKDECQDIEFDEGNIKAIMEAIKAHELPSTSGFFFGQSYRHGAKVQADWGVSQAEYDEGYVRQQAEDLAVFESALEFLSVKDTALERRIAKLPAEGGRKPYFSDYRSVIYKASW
jgi:hypothetical protein